MPEFDAIVIGAGQAGPSLAFRLAATGRRVAMVERQTRSAAPASTPAAPRPKPWSPAPASRSRPAARRNTASCCRARSASTGRVKARMDARGRPLPRRPQANRCETTENITFFRGHARFTGPHAVARERGAAGGADGSSSMSAAAPRRRPIPGLEAVPWLTNSRLLRLDALPRASGDHRRQLYRPGIRADLPPLRLRGDGGRTGAAADPARGRGGLRRDPRDAGGRGHGLPPRRQGHLGRAGRGWRRAAAGGRAGDPRLASAAGDRAAPEHRRPRPGGRRHRPRRAGLHHGGRRSCRPASPGVWALGECNGRGAFTHTAYNDYEIVAGQPAGGRARGG